MNYRFLLSTFTLCFLFLGSSGVFAEIKGLARESLTVPSTDGGDVQLYTQSHALLLGVSRYTNGWASLGAVPRELDTVQEVLEGQGFNVVRVDNPNSDELYSAFKNFIANYGYDANNRLLFYYSGHGHSDDRHGYLVPTNAPSPNEDIKGFLRSALDMNQIITWAKKISAKHALFLFDSCFSGTIFKSKSLPKTRDYFIDSMTALPVRQFITAGSAGEVVPARSTFTPAFVGAISKGLGDLNHDGYVTGSELGVYLSQEVPKYIDQIPQYGKIKDYELAQGDFVFSSGAIQEAEFAHTDSGESIDIAAADDMPLSSDIGSSSGGAYISHRPPAEPVSAGEPFVFTATVSDPALISKLKLFYRNSGETLFQSKSFNSVAIPGSFIVELPKGALTPPRLEYYLAAPDDVGALVTNGSSLAPLVLKLKPDSAVLAGANTQQSQSPDSAKTVSSRKWLWIGLGAAIVGALASSGGSDYAPGSSSSSGTDEGQITIVIPNP